MEFEQAFAGSGEWHFPSPTATPTQAASFGNNVLLQTPKTASFPSHFQDAFNTPQMPGFATPQQQQNLYGSMTPLQRPHSSSETLRSNYHANLQAGVNYNTQIPGQVVYSNQMQDVGMQASPAGSTMPSSSFDMSQMQTPPPTRGSSVKKPQQMPIAFGTPSTIASRRFMTPQQQSHAVLESPVPMGQGNGMVHPQMQFSPNMYDFSQTGPATAPVMPQMQSFWEQPSYPPQLADQNLNGSLLSPLQPQDLGWQGPPIQQPSSQAVSFATPAMTSFPVQSPHPRPSTAVPLGDYGSFAQAPQSSSASLDPSLIYSSPVRPIVRSASKTGKPRSRQPSATATKRKDSAEPDLSRTGTVPPADKVPAISGPGLRRSNTTGTVRSRSAQYPSMNETPHKPHSAAQMPRSASPLKRLGKTPLGSISEHRPQSRASVVLTIDENGRARTETREADASSPTKSVRERYPGLFDSDSSDDDSETGEPPPPSRSTSLSFANTDERRLKAARLDPPLENLVGLSIPRSHSSASVKSVTPSRAAIAAVAQLRKQGSLRRTSRTSPSKGRGASSSKTAAAAVPLTDACPMEVSDELPNAAPDSSISRPSIPPPQVGWTGVSGDFSAMGLGPHDTNHTWNPQRPNQQYPSSARPAQQYHQQQQSPPILVRCACGITEVQGPMVQCSSCTQWLHSACVGHAAGGHPGFTCFLCTKPRNAAYMSSR